MKKNIIFKFLLWVAVMSFLGAFIALYFGQNTLYKTLFLFSICLFLSII
jgi:hypothetical protein